MFGALRMLSAEADAVLSGIATRCAPTHRLSSLFELRRVLDEQPANSCSTLDLIGHSTRGHNYLRIGSTPLDLLDPIISRLFRVIATSGNLRRIGIETVRLLGCETAVTIAGQRTMALLSHILRVRVVGTRAALLKSHYDGVEFDPRFGHLLVEAGELERPFRRL
ncbi:MAG: hypothetical protein H0V17_15965 [Deltaproteobacteria bacterium]|nr:hypothetical protein [Deltaproteobacteria bacterium]